MTVFRLVSNEKGINNSEKCLINYRYGLWVVLCVSFFTTKLDCIDFSITINRIEKICGLNEGLRSTKLNRRFPRNPLANKEYKYLSAASWDFPVSHIYRKLNTKICPLWIHLMQC